jgi:hypothetical protein
MEPQSILPQLVKVKVTRVPAGVWAAECPELPCLSVMAGDESTLLAAIERQIAMLCRARGFEVEVARVGPLDGNITLWSIQAISAEGRRKKVRAR